MIIKYNAKKQFLALLIVLASGFIPVVSHASFFDWLKYSENTSSGASNLPFFQASYLYANSSFSGFQRKDSALLPIEFQENAVVQPSSLLTIEDDVDEKVPKKVMKVRLTAYSSTPDQTDDSPFITAKGTRVHDGIVAANFLPFNTLIKIPELYGDKVFVVEDRMHSRFQGTIDIWFPDRSSALEFGKKTAEIEIVGSL